MYIGRLSLHASLPWHSEVRAQKGARFGTGHFSERPVKLERPYSPSLALGAAYKRVSKRTGGLSYTSRNHGFSSANLQVFAISTAGLTIDMLEPATRQSVPRADSIRQDYRHVETAAGYSAFLLCVLNALMNQAPTTAEKVYLSPPVLKHSETF